MRWSEVDLQKIVFNAHYLTYVDTAMAAYWRRLAVPYEATMAALDGDVFLKNHHADLPRPSGIRRCIGCGHALREKQDVRRCSLKQRFGAVASY